MNKINVNLRKIKKVVGDKNFFKETLKLMLLYRELFLSDNDLPYNLGTYENEYYQRRKILIDAYNNHRQFGDDLSLFIYTINEKYKEDFKNRKAYSGPFLMNEKKLIKLLSDEVTTNMLFEFFKEIYTSNDIDCVKPILNELISLSKTDSTKLNSLTTSKEIREISYELLKQDNEIGVIGYGGISLLLNANPEDKISLCGLSDEYLEIAKIFVILLGLKNVDLDRIMIDIRDPDYHLDGNIFLDDTFTEKSFYREFRDLSLLGNSISSALLTLKPGKRAVIIVSTRLLSSLVRHSCYLRENLIKNGLKFVANIPSQWDKTKSGAQLLVVEKDYNSTINLFDWTKIKEDNDFEIIKEKIISSLDEKENKEYLYHLEPSSLDNDFILLPTNYFKDVKEEKERPLKEIENELDDAYKDLKNIL